MKSGVKDLNRRFSLDITALFTSLPIHSRSIATRRFSTTADCATVPLSCVAPIAYVSYRIFCMSYADF